jgi:hypothetical protein
MTDKTPATLDRLWTEVPTGHAPIDDILAAGHSAKRRSRRVVVAGTAAAIALILGGGVALNRILPGDGHGDQPVAGQPAGHRLGVHVTVGLTERLAALFPGTTPGEAAVWDLQDRHVLYRPEAFYGSSCPPTGTAEATDSGAVNLTVINDHGSGPCTTDAIRVLVHINGLTDPPPNLTVTLPGGASHSVPVSAPQSSRPMSNSWSRDSCGMPNGSAAGLNQRQSPAGWWALR